VTETQGVGVRTLRGMFWAYGSYVGGRLLVLVATALLARLLVPADFGLVALALAFIAFLEVAADLGLTQALVIADDEQAARRAHSVWTVSVLIGLASFALISALAPLAASFFDQPALVGLMPALGLNLFLRSLGSTHYALAQKRLDFRTRTLAELADVLVRAAAGIGLALAGAGAWSLVIGYVVGTAAMTVALWALVPWRPSVRLRRADLTGMISFGGALTAVNLLGAVLGVVDDLIVGRVLGAAKLGLYSLAYNLPQLLIINLSLVAGQVLFPAMASLERDALPRAFLTSLRYAMMVGLPLTVGLVVLAEPLLVGVFGSKWRAAAPAMQVMALWTLMSPIGIIIGTAYKSLGRADILLKLAIPQALVLIPAILVFVDRGIVAVAASQAAVAITFTAVAMFVAMRILSVSARGILMSLWPAVVASAGMGAVMLPVTRALSSPWLTLLAGGAVGLLVYGSLLWLVARETLRDLLAKAFPGSKPREPAG